LGVDRTASKATLKKAINRKRAEYDPDIPKNKGDESIAELYEDVLRAEDIFID